MAPKQKSKPAEEQASAIDKLPAMQALFVREYLADFNGRRAAIRAGYSSKSADVQASRLISSAKVQAAMAELQASRIERLEIKADELVRYWRNVLEANPNSLTEFRWLACRHCWGINFAYQCTPSEFQGKRIAHLEKRKGVLERFSEDIGDFPSIEGDWYDRNAAPNPECPECSGNGIGEVILKDTRKLTGPELALYAGVRKTKEGVEILTHSKEKAGEMLGRSLGVFNVENLQSDTHQDVIELARSFAEVMQAARDRQDAIYKERGITRTDR